MKLNTSMANNLDSLTRSTRAALPSQELTGDSTEDSTSESTAAKRYSLIRGCSLFEHNQGLVIGNLNRVATVTSNFQRSALAQLAQGEDPMANLYEPIRGEISTFILLLDSLGFLNHINAALTLPRRNLENKARVSNGDALDLAINQLNVRSAPELMQSEWIDGCGDGGTSTVAGRSQYVIELSGRSRVITLLYSLLLASGVTRVRFADDLRQCVIGDLDIGFGAITASDLGSNYYEILESRRRAISLFPIDRNERFTNDGSLPLLTAHCGDVDPELMTQWSNQRQPYLLIHMPIGDELAIGPLVEPGKSPCIRCLSLYERDHFGFTRTQRIPLTEIKDFPAIAAHYVAALAASKILHFIDDTTSMRKINPGKTNNNRATGLGEISYINLQHLTEPQVVAIARHPLCGCDK
ncbi:unannotated protein [freshwater metagenome]|uniref:Unannotated protein n=1 Tax=freshwater metagenome TaxID=449393 RepID=A0A6J7EVD2_9ZZZZ